MRNQAERNQADASRQVARALSKWERGSRAAARADDCAILRAHLQRLALPGKPKLMLEGTIALVRMRSAYLAMDRRYEAFQQFLGLQTYNPARARDARYVFTFDLCGKAFARVLVEAKLRTLDLADLYGSPWSRYRVVGFHDLWISHPDWSSLTSKEIRQLETAVTNDLRFDYGDDEISFWFDDSLDKSYLLVTVQDVEESGDNDESPGAHRPN